MRLTRRDWLLLSASAGCGARQARQTGQHFRLAVCSETFQTKDFAEVCRAARRTGYTGVEIAPFTLSDDPAAIPAGKRREYASIMASEDVVYAGLHSLLTVPAGALHITTPDEIARTRSWDYFARLIDLCADLGDGGLMVLGSGRQRGTAGGSSVEDATKRLEEGLAGAAEHASDRGVRILLEPLAPKLCDVVTTLDEAVRIVDAIGQPSVRTMFDVHNTTGETLPGSGLIQRYASYIEHVHINELDGRHPGTGSYDFSALLQALKDIGYGGWLSLEVFHFEPGGEEIARVSAEYLRKIEEQFN